MNRMLWWLLKCFFKPRASIFEIVVFVYIIDLLVHTQNWWYALYISVALIISDFVQEELIKDR